MVYAIIHREIKNSKTLYTILPLAGEDHQWIIDELERERTAYGWKEEDCELRFISAGYHLWFSLGDIGITN